MKPLSKLSIRDMDKIMIETYLKNYGLYNIVTVAKHFVERVAERNVKWEQVTKALIQIKKYICQILFDFKIGNIPYIQVDMYQFKLQSINDRKIQLVTVYKRPNSRQGYIV